MILITSKLNNQNFFYDMISLFVLLNFVEILADFT